MAASIARVVGLRTLAVSASRASGLLASKVYFTGAVGQPSLQSLGVLSANTGSTRCGLHTSSVLMWDKRKNAFGWMMHNKTVYPPTPFGEEQRPAFLCHMKSNIKYSPKKMWYVACLVRGLRIDDAINQLKFVHKKGSEAARETLEEARELAVKEHNVEFPSKLWVWSRSAERTARWICDPVVLGSIQGAGEKQCGIICRQRNGN
ncbi:large ribosomal subunit protein uL22m isoform X2 [Procambarus clarkii]|uniref:large ribosomal subunit protein uL22m isoform X2 n=1 Tax=Procambarus clarkii TaxID=6728 RepID=UPI001E67905A|nr:39S ribosomal protein L22, mitochondrial-like isoform X2 [Procambarus clarkii]